MALGARQRGAPVLDQHRVEARAGAAPAAGPGRAAHRPPPAGLVSSATGNARQAPGHFGARRGHLHLAAGAQGRRQQHAAALLQPPAPNAAQCRAAGQSPGAARPTMLRRLRRLRRPHRPPPGTGAASPSRTSARCGGTGTPAPRLRPGANRIRRPRHFVDAPAHRVAARGQLGIGEPQQVGEILVVTGARLQRRQPQHHAAPQPHRQQRGGGGQPRPRRRRRPVAAPAPAGQAMPAAASSTSAAGTSSAARRPAAGSSKTGSSTPAAEPDMARGVHRPRPRRAGKGDRGDQAGEERTAPRRPGSWPPDTAVAAVRSGF